MTDLQRARLALKYNRLTGEGTSKIDVLVKHGLGEFTFSPTMPEPKS